MPDRNGGTSEELDASFERRDSLKKLNGEDYTLFNPLDLHGINHKETHPFCRQVAEETQSEQAEVLPK